LHNFGEHVERATEAATTTGVQDTILLDTNLNQQDRDADVGLRLRHINQQAG
jgi:E3 ubiquitin-protein ligase MARCH6